MAITPITEKAKIILFSPAVAHPSYSEAGDYTFRNRPSITLEIQTISNFAKEKYRKAAILYTNKDPYPKIQEIFQKEFQQNNSEVAVIESAEAETKDFRTQLVKIKNTNPDVIFFALYSPKENGLAMKQARELSIKVPFLSMVAIQNPEFVQTSGGAGESVVYAAFVSSTSEDFISNYKAKYNEKPGLFAPEAYDAVKIIALGIKNVESIQIALRNICIKLRIIQVSPGLQLLMKRAMYQSQSKLRLSRMASLCRMKNNNAKKKFCFSLKMFTFITEG